MSDELKPADCSRLWSLRGVQIAGTGSFLPENEVRNEDLAALGYDDEWILQRTGIKARRHAPPEMATSDMAVEAGQRAIAAAGVDPADVDMLLLATLSPDYLLPATASSVQHRLGLNCPAFDVSAACAGFLYALITGMQYVATGCSRYALVIGADTNSRVMNPADKKTYPLFGDGAGAVLLTPGTQDQGLLAYTLGSDGEGAELLYRPKGGSRESFALPTDLDRQFVCMNGRPVFKWAVRLIEDTSNKVLEQAQLSHDDVDLWILHQANTRIIDAAAGSMEIDRERVVMHLDRYGNTSGASVPIALDETNAAGRIKPGTTIVMSGFGGGLVWGTGVFRW